MRGWKGFYIGNHVDVPVILVDEAEGVFRDPPGRRAGAEVLRNVVDLANDLEFLRLDVNCVEDFSVEGLESLGGMDRLYDFFAY